MTMFNPPHPGELIVELYLKLRNISRRELAKKLEVAASAMSRIFNGSSHVTPKMDLPLPKAIGGSPESWLAKQHVDLSGVRKLRLVKG